MAKMRNENYVEVDDNNNYVEVDDINMSQKPPTYKNACSIYVCVYMYTCIYIFICMSVCMYVFIYIYVCLYVCLFVYMYIYIYIYIYISKLQKLHKEAMHERQNFSSVQEQMQRRATELEDRACYLEVLRSRDPFSKRPVESSETRFTLNQVTRIGA